MNNNVTIRLAGQVIVPNENGELEFESGAGTKTKIPGEEIHTRLLQAQSLEEAFDYLKESGAYIGVESSRIMIAQTPNGTMIFAKDEPSRKIVVDRELPETAIQQILSIDAFDDGRAVEKILIENRVIEEPDKEMEEVITSDIDNRSFERQADNIGELDNSGGLIAENRETRDELKDQNRGIYNEEQRRRIDEERQKKIREERANVDRDDGMDR